MNKSKIYGIPKAELHIHAEATLQPELLLTLCERNKIEMPYRDAEDVRRSLEFKDLVSFLNTYYMHIGALQKEQDFYELVHHYVEAASRQGVRHFELFFDPQAHTRRGVPLEVVLDGLSNGIRAACRSHRISGALLMSFLRDLPEEDAFDTLEQALTLNADILGVGLDSAEVGNPPGKFKRVFERARAEGLHVVAHAGEEGPPAYIWEALQELKVERIDHGVKCDKDAALVDYLVANKTPLTVCPLSNVRLKVFDKLENHNVISLLRRGVKVNVNADGPAFFGGYVGDNFVALAEAFPDLVWGELLQLAENSFAASFISDAERAALQAELDAYSGAAEIDKSRPVLKTD